MSIRVEIAQQHGESLPIRMVWVDAELSSAEGLVIWSTPMGNWSVTHAISGHRVRVFDTEADAQLWCTLADLRNFKWWNWTQHNPEKKDEARDVAERIDAAFDRFKELTE